MTVKVPSVVANALFSKRASVWSVSRAFADLVWILALLNSCRMVLSSRMAWEGAPGSGTRHTWGPTKASRVSACLAGPVGEFGAAVWAFCIFLQQFGGRRTRARSWRLKITLVSRPLGENREVEIGYRLVEAQTCGWMSNQAGLWLKICAVSDRQVGGWGKCKLVKKWFSETPKFFELYDSKLSHHFIGKGILKVVEITVIGKYLFKCEVLNLWKYSFLID